MIGFSVASAGDVKGDGYSDVIVGAPFYDNGENSEGRAFVYHGFPTGLGASSDEVRVFVYHGSASGLAASPAWTGEADQASSSYGISVATAGDVNGNGYADVIIGSVWYDNGQSDEGRAFVYHGAAAVVGAADPPRAAAVSADLRIEGIPFGRERHVVPYALPRSGRVRLSIHDVRGRCVATLGSGMESAGARSIAWDGRDAEGEGVNAGVLWARLECDGEVVRRKFVRLP
jgi:hypothetical protein